jgi:DNA polymerase III epsilon subunit-like protein
MTLPSGIHLYCDADGHETRALASVKRGNPSEADGFFLERLAESRGHAFGIELSGPPPDRVHSAIGDREFLADVFVELFEGTEHEAGLRACATADTATEVGQAFRPAGGGTDFRAVVADWLERVLTAPTMGRRQPRLRDEDPLL